MGRNKATHFVGIPLIVFSLLRILALWQVNIGRTTAAAAIVAALAVLRADLAPLMTQHVTAR